MQTVPSTNGTYFVFWDDVLSNYRRFFVAREVIEDLADSVTAISVATRIPSTSSGAYIFREDGPIVQVHRREVRTLELFNNVELPVETAVEYS